METTLPPGIPAGIRAAGIQEPATPELGIREPGIPAGIRAAGIQEPATPEPATQAPAILAA